MIRVPHISGPTFRCIETCKISSFLGGRRKEAGSGYECDDVDAAGVDKQSEERGGHSVRDEWRGGDEATQVKWQEGDNTRQVE